MTDPGTGVAAAYEECRRITNAEARNFAYGIRLLPPPKRRAMTAVYALARRIDDVGDGSLPAGRKQARLESLRAEVAALRQGHPPDPADAVLVAVADAAARYGLPLDAFGELIDGCAADVAGLAYESFGQLVGYCRRVAGTIGRLSLAVFGSARPDVAAPMADALGVALQLTNILRDVIEDAAMGRVYLPAEDLERFGCRIAPGRPPEDRARLAAVVAFEADRAEEWYTEGLGLLPLLDGRSRACVATMAGIYHRLLGRIRREPAAVLRGRLSLPAREKAWVAATSLAATSLPGSRPAR
jgi:phytoene synthase